MSGGPDPARPGKYILHEETVGPLNERGKPLTDRDLERLLADFVVRAQRGELARTTATVNDLLDEYFKALEIQDRDSSTLRTYRSYARRWVRPRIGHLAVPTVTRKHVDAIYEAMVDAGKAPRTINQVHAICHKAFRLAVGWDYITMNPADGTIRPTPKNVGGKTPVQQEPTARILVHADACDPEIGTFLIVGLGAGLRRGENAALRWNDILWDHNALRIELALALDDDGKESDEGKTYKERYGTTKVVTKDPKDHQKRLVDVPPSVIARLRNHRRRAEQIARFARVEIKEGGFVYSPDPDGSTPRRPDYFTDAWARAREAVGAPKDIQMKHLRNLYATVVHDRTGNLELVRDMLGHDRLTTTESYTVTMPGRHAEAAAAAEEGLDLRRLAGLDSEGSETA